ncbi:MAG: hypothetical protein HYT50_01300 [Candidatus Wildermuthbacteria bacterium]|nr:hypothetical protein [Candidatus Wildermuthbacteria bacterium]
MEESKTCNCVHHSFFPVLVMALGATFLLGALDVITQRVVDLTWPSIVIAAGALKLGAKKCKCC